MNQQKIDLFDMINLTRQSLCNIFAEVYYDIEISYVLMNYQFSFKIQKKCCSGRLVLPPIRSFSSSQLVFDQKRSFTSWQVVISDLSGVPVRRDIWVVFTHILFIREPSTERCIDKPYVETYQVFGRVAYYILPRGK